MSEIKHGLVTVTLPDTVVFPAQAGRLSTDQVQALPRGRPGIGLVAERTARAMGQSPERLTVSGVDPTKLAAAGKTADEADKVVHDIEAIATICRQGNMLLDAEAHESLRRVLAHVRAQEKFDPRIVDLVPDLIAYFSSTKAKATSTETAPTAP